MIRVNKAANSPKILKTRGKKARRAHCRAFAANSARYRTGELLFRFKKSVYAARSVKSALRKDQQDKCAFCESKFTATGYGDVEHYRPKAGYVQDESDELARPGYYWLAYEWSNLFFSCQICNQRFKKNWFPLRNPSSRARSYEDDHTLEQPPLVDPSKTPERFLAFHMEEEYAVEKCREGSTTIALLGLNRDELVELRCDRLAIIRRLKESNELLKKSLGDNPEAKDQIAKNEEILRQHSLDSAEYAAMNRAFLLR